MTGSTETVRKVASNTTVRHYLARVAFGLVLTIVGLLFALPLVWLVLAPFDATPTLSLEWPDWTLDNFARLFQNPYAMRSIGNSLLLGVGTMIIVVVLGALAAYAMSRIRIPGRDGILYGLLLLSSIVTGTAAMVPTFQIITSLGLINTYTGVLLVLAGGILPTVIFILKDFMDSIPKSYEESARLYGAGPFRILRDVVVPIARPGLAFIAIWTIVQVWGNFLVPFILLRSPDLQPAAVLMYTFYTESGQADLRLISAFALLFSAPVLIIYFVVNRRYGFRFHGGIKS
ncbi:carbohydrate ABC transporter permease [Agromyces sp. H3Y2-19a]|jgi:multiple sugar transport system permease protein|uniref:carbohydrate ABC transporter permease n=1 Tax=Agromyces TaxID=33877 RepID=UPI001E4EA357|nr:MULTISPECIES: carbohydrate ABC transporter permease [Agromyces]MCD5345336.1 carbohydrate ABC transporter permease [Agromyces sp. S2-1-8]MDF0513505.1 carbohydrate ABC transporter permease [Agromyces chromiiresistens]